VLSYQFGDIISTELNRDVVQDKSFTSDNEFLSTKMNSKCYEIKK